MSGDMKRVMLLIDDKSTLEEVTRRAPPSLRGDLPEILQQFLDAELIRDKEKSTAAAKMVAPKMVAPKFSAPGDDELDFTNMASASAPAIAEEAAKHKARQEAEQKARRDAEEVRARAELEAAAAAAKLKAATEAEAKLRQEAESAMRAKAEAEAAAKAKCEAEEKRLAQEKVRLEMEARQRAEQEAARLKAELEAVRAKAEQELLRAKALAEERAKQEAEAARLKEEHEAALAKAEAELLARHAAELARIKAEQEAARIKAEQEAARIKAEQEAARIRAEQEAARIKAEQEAARIKAEQEMARIKAEREEAARIKAEQEVARIKAEQEAARIKAEQEAARIKAEQEVARIKAEQEAAERAKAEQELAARIRAEQEEAARLRVEQEAAIARAEEEAKAQAMRRALEEAEAARAKAEREAALLIEQQLAAARAQAELERLAKLAAETERVKAEQDKAIRLAVAAKLDAEERAKREAQIAELAGLTPAPVATELPGLSPFQINLDSLSLGVLQTSAESPQATQVAEALKSDEEALAIAKQEAEQHAADEQAAQQIAETEAANQIDDKELARLHALQEARIKEEEKALAEEQANIWAEAEQRAKLQAKLDAEMAAQQAAASQAKAVQKPVASARRKQLPIGKILMGTVLLLLVAVLALPYVWPMKKYIATMEAVLSEQLHQPVQIGEMSAATFPPHLRLKKITVGIEQELKIGTAVLNFDAATLFSANKTISNVELQAVVLDGYNLEQVVGWAKSLEGNTRYSLRHLAISGLQLEAEEVELSALSGDAELEQGRFSRLALRSVDDKLKVELLPLEERWQLAVAIKGMALPMLPAVKFDDFSAKGELGDGEVNFGEIGAHAYGGTWSGSGKLSWRKGWQAQGRIQAKEMELEKLFSTVGTSSDVAVEGAFSMQAARLSQMGDAPRLDGSFVAKNGVLHGMGIAETARQLSREHLSGERTRFDQMSGSVQMENRNVRLGQIKIVSDEMTASGLIELGASGQLSGNFNAEVNDVEGNSALVLSGTLLEPKLKAR